MAMPIIKKRFRTKFTQEQKDKMCSFAKKGMVEIWNKIILNILDIYILKKNPYYL